jgi:hypothetical protein
MSIFKSATGAFRPSSRIWIYRVPTQGPDLVAEDLLLLTSAPGVDPCAIGLRHRVARAVHRSMRGASRMAQMLAVEMIDTLCFSMQAGDLVLGFDGQGGTVRPGRIEAGVRRWRGHLARPVRWHTQVLALDAIPGLRPPPPSIEICEVARRDLARWLAPMMDQLPGSPVENRKKDFPQPGPAA